MGFLRHLAPHTFTPNRRTRRREAKPHRLLRKRYVSRLLHPKRSAEYDLASPPSHKAFIGIHR